MTIWAWIQPVDKLWKVVSDPEKGTIHVFDERSDLIMEKKGLSPEAVALIERHFLEIVATRLTQSMQKPGNASVIDVRKPSTEYNYMYA